MGLKRMQWGDSKFTFGGAPGVWAMPGELHRRVRLCPWRELAAGWGRSQKDLLIFIMIGTATTKKKLTK